MSSPLIAKLFPKDKYRVSVYHYNGLQVNDPKCNWRTEVFVWTADGQKMLCSGEAQCSKLDQPVRKTGFLLAVKRAYNNLKNVK